ncbi:MAG: WbqC family protein [Bacteroidales bacterium]|nr:WbqC family protein [Bacteroidales bacterium]
MLKDNNPILLSTAYFPPVEYFALLSSFRVIIEQHETYKKQSYRNRCEIFSEKGTMPLSIPVTKPQGNHTSTKQVLLRNEDKWYIKHWRAIQSAYESSPFYLYYKDDLREFLSGKYDNLFDLNLKIILKVSDLIGIRPLISFTEQFEWETDNIIDLRNEISPKRENFIADFPSYIQVFSDRKGFIPNLSILDLLFNLGSESKAYLENFTFDKLQGNNQSG